jgi:anti-sigma regulatory factor (Ser/Thr protein kinase)
LRNAKEAFSGLSAVTVRSAQPSWICLRIEPDIAVKDSIIEFFYGQLEDLAPELRNDLCTALDELLGNAFEHGSASELRSGVDLSYIRTSRMLLWQIKDAGPGFSLDSLPHAALSNPPEDPLRHAEHRSRLGLRPGGFGIMLVKQIADDLIYNEQGNEVVLVKYL